ncbi:MAG TPA: glycerol-3-phosphate 1-O-acyltransferase PlsY [Polyangia bacterium]|nr:glycerol-3-phosphate 1-O-acyltransferase PlsY [Polyangia bacterium]
MSAIGAEWLIAAALAGGFLLGSIPFGVVFAKLRGVDLQKVGSGNIGATNAARALGRGIGVLVLLCDAGKAALPIVLARRLLAGEPRLDWILAAIGGGAVLGHMFSPWLRGRGGKGVATGFGTFLVLAPFPAAIAAGAWVLLYALSRISSVGSLTALAVLPAALALHHEPRAYLALVLALDPVILWKHRDNIRRLVRREETKV